MLFSRVLKQQETNCLLTTWLPKRGKGGFRQCVLPPVSTIAHMTPDTDHRSHDARCRPQLTRRQKCVLLPMTTIDHISPERQFTGRQCQTDSLSEKLYAHFTDINFENALFKYAEQYVIPFLHDYIRWNKHCSGSDLAVNPFKYAYMFI